MRGRDLYLILYSEDEKIKSLEPGEYEVEIELEENTKKIVAISIEGHIIKIPESKPVPKVQPKQEYSQFQKTSIVPEQAYAPYNFISLDDIVIFYNKDALPRRTLLLVYQEGLILILRPRPPFIFREH